MTGPLLSLVAACLTFGLSSCIDRSPAVSTTTSGTFAESGGVGLTGGGHHVATGEPVLVFGSVLEQRDRAYTYLIVAENLGRDDGSFGLSADSSTTVAAGEASSSSEIQVGQATFTASFEARIEGERLVDPVLVLNGETIPAGQWLFRYDALQPERGLVPIDEPMPRLPRDAEELGAFSADFARTLTSSGSWPGDR